MKTLQVKLCSKLSHLNYPPLTVAEEPTNLTATIFQSNSSHVNVTVSWESPADPVTGYVIYYQTKGGPVISDMVSGGETETHSLDGFQRGVTYYIFILALSQHLPSPLVGPVTAISPGITPTHTSSISPKSANDMSIISSNRLSHETASSSISTTISTSINEESFQPASHQTKVPLEVYILNLVILKTPMHILQFSTVGIYATLAQHINIGSRSITATMFPPNSTPFPTGDFKIGTKPLLLADET